MRWRWLLGVGAVAIIVAIVWPRHAAKPATVTAKPTIERARTSSKRDPKALPAATIDGAVRDEANKPLANATVCAVYAADDYRCVHSGADGRYRLADVVPDELWISTTLAKYRPHSTDLPALEPGEHRTVDVVLQGGAVELAGIVEDILGGPIARARVIAEGSRALTDDEGRFSIWMSPGGGVRHVDVDASGYGPRSQAVKAPGKVVIALAPESTITGRVVDAATGTPIGGARVIAGPRHLEATAGPDGTFSFEGLPAGTVKLAALAPARYGRLDRGITVGVGERVEGVVVQIYPAHSVVATIEVVGDRKICNPAPALSDWHLDVPTPWRDDGGRYHFDGVPPGTYTVALGCGLPVPPVVVAGGDVEVTWRVEVGGIVRGKIARQHTESTSTEVQLARVGSLKPPLARQQRDDRFEFRGVPPGTYTLRAMFHRNVPGKAETIEVANDQTTERELVLERPAGGRVVGKVVDDVGPVARAHVRLVSLDAAQSYPVEVRDGRFELELPEGAYSALAVGEVPRGDADHVVRVTAGETTTFELTLDRAHREDDLNSPLAPPDREQRYELAGRVVDARGAPVAVAIVTTPEQGWSDPEDPALRVLTRADGSFAFVSKRASIDVDVYRVGGGRATATLVSGRPSTITLAREAAITGTVTRADGSPAPRFQLRIGDGPRGRTENFDHTGGRFTIADRGEYPLQLVAQINGVAGEPITITADSAKTGIALRLPAAVTITGRVVDGATRKPIANVRLDGRQGLDGWAPWFIHADQVTDGDGRFTMRDLPPGPLVLELTPPTDSWSAQAMTITVPQAAGDVGELGLAQVRRR